MAAPHNASTHQTLATNPDPALDIAHEHHHAHLHHGGAAAKPSTDDIAYTTGTTKEPALLLNPDPVENAAHRHHPGLEKTGEKGNLDVKDYEKGSIGRADSSSQEEEDLKKQSWFSKFYAKYRIFFHLFFFLLFTGWWIASLVLHRNDKNWTKTFLLWLFVTIRLVTLHVPVSLVMKPVRAVWRSTAPRVVGLIPEKFRNLVGGAIVVAVFIVGTFASEETPQNPRSSRAISCLGLIVFISCFYITSRDRKRIDWHPVIVGFLVQFIIALFVLRTGAGFDIFQFISELARSLLGSAAAGTAFLTNEETAGLKWFLIGVIPAIIFFVSFVQLLYYWGLLQWVIKKCAVFFFWAMRVSGAEAVVASASPFIGQGESAMLIKPFVAHLTMAELHLVMTAGFATIAGSVLVAYISMGLNPQVLISSCVMSIPASLAISKLRYPETEETLTAGRVVIPDDDEHRAANALHAFANGAWLGIKIAGMIVATLLCIIALVNLINALLGWWGSFLNLDGDYRLSLQLILGYVFFPVAWLLGVSPNNKKELLLVGRLIGIKVIFNEFVAYDSLVDPKQPYLGGLSKRATLIATYALCGFGNIGSLGTQIGVLSQISPSRSGDVSKLAFSALVSGVVATLTSATIAGMLITDE